MTSLTITPNWKNKTAKFKGTIAAGEHVAVSIANDDGYITDTTNLRLRVVHPANGKTLAQFPMPETVDDETDGENEVLPSSEAPAEGEVDWASDTTPLFCILNLNTDRMLMAVPPAANVPLLFVLDDYEGKTLYFKDYCEVTHWPRRVGEEEPVNLDDYKDIIADFREDIYGENGFKDRVENAERAALAAENSARLAAERAGNSESGAEAAASAAQASAANAANAKTAAETAQGKAEEAQSAAETAKENAIAAKSAAETAQGKAETAQAAAETAARNAASAAASAVAEVAGDLANEVTRAQGAESDLSGAIEAEKTRAEGAETGLASDLAGAFKAVAYDSTARKIVFTKQDGTTADIDASEFIKDGMISSVVISGGNLVITFNSDAGKQPISIPLAQIFNPSNYYDKTAADDRFVQKESGKVLSTNDYTTEEKEKLAGIESGAKNNVLEYANLAAFPVTGEANRIYVAKDTNNTYRWETNAYVQIGGGGGGGTTNYDNLSNKPSINGVTLSGNKTAEDLGLATLEEVGELAGEVIAKYTKPQGGIPAMDMTQAVQASLGKADTAVQRSGDTMTGGLTVPNLTVGSRKENSTVGVNSTAEGFDTVASGFASHAEGDNTVANSKSSHAEGAVTEASGRDSHAEGNSTTASGDASHAEGRGTAASGDDSHAEGTSTTASGEGSHAEGDGTEASGDYSHAEGRYTVASGDDSHAEGRGTITSNEAEHAEGFYNLTHTGANLGDCTQHTIGVGDDDEHRKNAVEVMYDGKVFVLDVGGYDGTNPTGQQNAATDLATEVNGKAPLASPAFTGTPTAPTPAAADNSTKVATTEFVQAAIADISVTPLSGRDFDFATTQGVMDALKATIEALGGTVTNAPATPAQNNQTQGE